MRSLHKLATQTFQGLGPEVQVSGLQAKGSDLRVSGLGRQVEDGGFEVQVLGPRVRDSRLYDMLEISALRPVRQTV